MSNMLDDHKDDIPGLATRQHCLQNKTLFNGVKGTTKSLAYMFCAARILLF